MVNALKAVRAEAPHAEVAIAGYPGNAFGVVQLAGPHDDPLAAGLSGADR